MKGLIAALVLLAPHAAVLPALAQAPRTVVNVAPPTGEEETDRASILAALGEAEPGDTIRFAPGTYLVGEVIRIETPGIALLGHPDGTMLRGCDPDEYDRTERDVADSGATGEARREAAGRCGMLELTGGDVTVRALTFELSRMGLILGCCQLEMMFRSTEGGYVVEGNTFRSSLNGIRPFTTERSVIRGNRFIDTFHAISGAGSGLHVLDNEISVSDPPRVPPIGHPSFSIALGPFPRRAAEAVGIDVNGEDNVIEGNRIEGHPDGIHIAALPGTRYRNNVIRDNTIIVERVPIPPSGSLPYIVDVADETDPTIVGIPIALYAVEGLPGRPVEEIEEGTFEGNLIEGNRLIGAEGVGIAIHRGSRNRIVGNTISGIRRREPFPGNTVLSRSEMWRDANGSAIWLSEGSDGNEIVGNAFEGVAGVAVYLEGDGNRVELSSQADSVRDLGSGNEIEHVQDASDPQTWSDPSPHAVRFVTVAPDVQLEVLEWGGSGEPLVFLAGQNINAHTFDDFAPRFTDTHRVIGITRRGHGASSWPDAGYSLDRRVEDIRAVLDSLGLERVFLAGHSLAGGEITRLARDDPERVLGLIYIDAAHDDGIIEGLRIGEVCPLGPEIEEAVARGFENPEAFRRTQRRRADDGTSIPNVADAALASISSTSTIDYSVVRAPTLAVYHVPYHANDIFGGVALPDACASAFLRYIYEGIAHFAASVPTAKIVAIQDGQHNLHLTAPDELEAVMDEWLETLAEDVRDSRRSP